MNRGIEGLIGVVAAEVLVDAVETSQRLSELGIPHALIGGFAVGIHGHPRATKDVDFLVGVEAFESTQPLLIFREELKDLVRLGVVDLMGVPPAYPALAEHLAIPEAGDIPVLPVPALVLIKLLAGRHQDVADVSALLESGADPGEIVRYLRKNAPGLVTKFAEIVG